MEEAPAEAEEGLFRWLEDEMATWGAESVDAGAAYMEDLLPPSLSSSAVPVAAAAAAPAAAPAAPNAEEEEKRAKRRAIVQRSRKRKKERMEQLEEQSEHWKRERLQLQQRLAKANADDAAGAALCMEREGIIRSALALVNSDGAQGLAEAASRIFAPDCKLISPDLAEELVGLAGVVSYWTRLFVAFSDLRITVVLCTPLDVLGDTFKVKWSVVGTHQNEFCGIAPVNGNRQMTFSGFAIVKFDEMNRISQQCSTWDAHQMFCALMDISLPPSAAAAAPAAEE